jgi:hypothetical protein
MNAIQIDIMRVLCTEPSTTGDGWFGGRDVAARMNPRLELSHIFDATANQLWQCGYIHGEGGDAPDWNRLLQATAEGHATFSQFVAQDKSKFVEESVRYQHPKPKGSPPPSKWIIGKANILEVLDQPNEKWNWILSLSRDFDGPIKTREGGASIANREELFEWFEKALERYGKQETREKDRKTAGKDTFTYGRNGTVAPQINGSVKKKRAKQ